MIKFNNEDYITIKGEDGNTTFQETNSYKVDKDLSKIKFDLFPYDEFEDY